MDKKVLTAEQIEEWRSLTWKCGYPEGPLTPKGITELNALCDLALQALAQQRSFGEGYARAGGMASPSLPKPEIESEFSEGWRNGLEAAAKVCDREAEFYKHGDGHAATAAKNCAYAIRALKEPS